MRTFGGDSEVVQAVGQLEKNPSSAGRKQTVAGELANAKADTNPELVAAAEQVLVSQGALAKQVQPLSHDRRSVELPRSGWETACPKSSRFALCSGTRRRGDKQDKV